MISWMQKHRKWLVITIWISTIAFIGAGVVGWGQYNYGKKASSIAKVGDVEITNQELQQSYTQLYNYFNQMMQGKFDEQQAKQFGLQKQALNQLINQALILNLAKSYNLQVSDDELLKVITTQKEFFTNGVFDKELYKTLLSRNNMTTKEYENGLKKELLISKTLNLFALTPTPLEEKSIQTALNIADKLNYKILDTSMINISPTEEQLKALWNSKKTEFMTEAGYDVSYIVQPAIHKEYTDAELTDYYNTNKMQFTDANGNIKTQVNAKEQIIKLLNDEATKKESLKTYIAFKKGELDKNLSIKNAIVNSSNNIFNQDVLQELATLTEQKAYMKPKLLNNEFVIIKLNKIIPSVQKSFEEAKPQVLALFMATAKEEELLKIAQSSVATFSGTNTDFITIKDTKGMNGLSEQDEAEFLGKLFSTNKKRGFVTLNNKKIVLFTVLEQKLLNNSKDNVNSLVLKFKTDLLNENLLKMLKKQYKTEIFVEGL
jgi:peptidyl-prolyl cis-trans isomerase D